MSDIDHITDDELVRSVVEEICPSNVYKYITGEGYYVNHHGDIGKDDWGHPWRPLESWDDCMMVADAIALRPYLTRKIFQDFVTDFGMKWFADIGHQDILRAALRAIRSENQAGKTNPA